MLRIMSTTDTTDKELPPGQRRILEVFAEAAMAGRQCTRAEVAEAVGYAYPSAVTKHTDALVRKGYMACEADKKRNTFITELGWQALGMAPSGAGVPILGSIAAGLPILAAANHDGYLKDLAGSSKRFALQVRGDSMIDAGINDGDYAIIDADRSVRSGSIGAVLIGDDATLKRIRRERSRLVLESANKRYKPIILDSRQDRDTVRVIGALRFVYRPF